MRASPVDYIGIISCQLQQKHSEVRKRIIGESISRNILINGFGLCAGTITEPVSYAFKFAKRHSGITRLITETDVQFNQRHLCDILELVQNDLQKHELISDVCIGGLVVSDGLEVSHLAQCFINKSKPVVAVNSIVDTTKLPQLVASSLDFVSAVELLIKLAQQKSSVPGLKLSV